jgi:hypothetical protein
MVILSYFNDYFDKNQARVEVILMVEYMERKYWKLMNYLRYDSSVFFNDEIKAILNEVGYHMDSTKVNLSKDSILYRSQLGCDFDDDGIPIPYPALRMFPLEKSATEGRANPKGIPYLYLATSKNVSISEVRPWPGKYVSLGYFSVKEDLALVDFTTGDRNNCYIDFENYKLLAKDDIDNLWGELNKAFSVPVFQSDTNADYVVTQVVSELAKSKGYDGIVYNSGYSRENYEGYNVVLFNKDAVDIRKLEIHKIESVDIKYSECNNPYYLG